MDKPTKSLLEEIQAAFPTIQWESEVLEEVVTLHFGVITGFPELLEDMDRLCRIDLGDLAPAGPLIPPL